MKSLAQLREEVMGQSNWDPEDSPTFQTRLRNMINQQVRAVYSEFSNQFAEGVVRFYLEPNITSTDQLDRVSFIAGGDDPYQLVSNATAANMTTEVPADLTWDGRYIELVSEGERYIRQISSVIVDGNIYIFVTEPLPSTMGDVTEWTVFTPSYPLPVDVDMILATTLVEDDFKYNLVTQPARYNFSPINNLRNVTGIPTTITKQDNFNFQGVSIGPGVEADASLNWLGPEPFGQFSYKITLGWGILDRTTHVGGVPSKDYAYSTDVAALHRSPRFESFPSPASDTITVAEVQSVLPKAVKLTIPRFDYMQGNGHDLTLYSGSYTRAHRFGPRARIWRRRHTTDWSGYSSLTTVVGGAVLDGARRLAPSDAYYLIGDMRINTTNLGYFYDQGNVTPTIRMPSDLGVHVNYSFNFMPDRNYEVFMRTYKKPAELIDESDVVFLPAILSDLVVWRTIKQLAAHENKYNELSHAKSVVADLERSARSQAQRFLRPKLGVSRGVV